MTCSVSLNICERCVFLALKIIITIYCHICIFCRAKNNLRIFRGSIKQKIENIEAQQKINYSYKKKSVIAPSELGIPREIRFNYLPFLYQDIISTRG